MHYYSFNIGDYASHTSRLSPMEDLAYRRLLDLYYLNEQPLNGCASDVAREVGLMDHVESVEYVLSKFFTKDENVFRQKRIDLEIKKYKSNAKNKSKAGKASAKARRAKASKGVTGVEQVLNTESTDEQLTNNHKPITNNHLKDKDIEQNDLLENGFDIFYSAGLVKKSKQQAFKKFKALAKQMKADPIEFGQLLAQDVQARIAKQQYGIDKLHPSTYLNNERWTDEHEETNNGQPTPTGKQSAVERQQARINAKYAYAGGLGMAEGSGDLRGAMGEGERGRTVTHVESGTEQAGSIDCEEWNQTDC